MKKVLSLILALVICLSLCACGGTTNSTEPSTTEPAITEPSATEPIEKELKELVIGTWVREYEYNDTYYVTTINIYKGGTGTFGTVETEDDYKTLVTNDPFQTTPSKTTWETQDDILNISIDDGFFGTTVMGFTYQNEDQETLQSVDGTKTYLRKAD